MKYHRKQKFFEHYSKTVAATNRREYHIYKCIDQDPYPVWEEMESCSVRRRWGRKIQSKLYRKYRTWKHNRKTQYK